MLLGLGRKCLWGETKTTKANDTVAGVGVGTEARGGRSNINTEHMELLKKKKKSNPNQKKIKYGEHL